MTTDRVNAMGAQPVPTVVADSPPHPDSDPRVAPGLPAEGVYQRFRRQRFFSCLDGLRAVSILAVIWHHAAASAFAPDVPLVHLGNRGVNLFFVISAFLISTLLLRSKRDQALNVPRFWLRRALRILPLYYAMLATYAVLAFTLEHDPAARSGFFAHLPYFVTFTSNWFVELDTPRVIFYFAWSLAAEEQFYLCWPWIERSLSRFWPAMVALGLLLVTQIAGWRYEHSTDHALGLKMLASVPPAILGGVILAHVLDLPGGFRRVVALAGRKGAAFAAVVLLVTALWLDPYLGFASGIVDAVAMVFLVATCVVREDGDLAPFLRLRAVAWIGTISYGIYLMHMLCIGMLRPVVTRAFGSHSAIPLFAASALLSMAVASLSYVTYERFFLRLKDRWFSDRRQPSVAPAAAISVVPVSAPAAGGTASSVST